MLNVPAVFNGVSGIAPEVLEERPGARYRVKVVVRPPRQGLLKQTLTVETRGVDGPLATSLAVKVGLCVGRQDSAVLDIIINAQVVTDPQDYF